MTYEDLLEKITDALYDALRKTESYFSDKAIDREARIAVVRVLNSAEVLAAIAESEETHDNARAV